MLDSVKNELKNKVKDDGLVDNLFTSFQKISEEFIAKKPIDLLQNTGLFVESTLRVAEHIVLGIHTPLSSKFDVDKSIAKLEKAQGFEGLRIFVARLSRSIYDFRSRKKAVHLKAVDPELIHASLIFNICTWIFIEILKESGVSNSEDSIKLLFSRNIPLVQAVGGILGTTNPNLLGPQRILLLLYSAPNGLTEEQLFHGTKQKIRDRSHLGKNLKNMDKTDLVHKLPNGNWTLFGRGLIETEKLITKFS